ncbi:MAG: hypothetical protein FD130_631 [Halothiobacillaceae bacterium]|nr:MAG: hypothetical protein FD130_631 [Halothiobacillaceae bacterium]
MSPSLESSPLLEFIVDKINVGIFVIDAEFRVEVWNRFMEVHSGHRAQSVVGNNLFELFPELAESEKWLRRKVHNIFAMKSSSFTSWEQRPYLFRFRHNRPVTGGVDCMRQNCTFLPMKSAVGEVAYVCVMLFDVTDVSIYQNMLQSTLVSLEDASNRDGLTDIYNRRFFEQTLMREYSRAQRYGSTLSLALLDLDHFKSINDMHGHLAGDDVLREAAQRLGSGLRDTDIFARYGGEEFAVILPETTLTGALVVAERLREAVDATPIMHNTQPLIVTISVGVTEFRPDIGRYEELIKEADLALYTSKSSGRNRVTGYKPTASTE